MQLNDESNGSSGEKKREKGREKNTRGKYN